MRGACERRLLLLLRIQSGIDPDSAERARLLVGLRVACVSVVVMASFIAMVRPMNVVMVMDRARMVHHGWPIDDVRTVYDGGDGHVYVEMHVARLRFCWSSEREADRSHGRQHEYWCFHYFLLSRAPFSRLSRNNGRAAPWDDTAGRDGVQLAPAVAAD